MDETRIQQALGNLFDKQRIVFWYDSNREFRAEFEALALPGVEKIELGNNAFGVKYRLLREQPTQKFLLYREGAEPEHLQNWLLDVQLASGNAFRTDQVALWLAELGLGPDFYLLLQDHKAFFESARRREALRKLMESGDSQTLLQRKMLAVCAGVEPRLDVLLEALLGDLAAGEETRIKLIGRSGLDGYLWEQMKRVYGYDSAQPGLRDFVIGLFESCFLMETDPEYKARLSVEALVFLNRWKDSRSHQQGFETLSADCAQVLQIDDKLQSFDYRKLMGLDYFELIDQKILSELVHAVTARTMGAQEVEQWIRQRRQGHWFERFKGVYLALEQAARFIQLLDATQLEMSSLAEGVQKYAQHWYRLDQHYRKFVYHLRECGQASLLGELAAQVDNLYSNSFLSRLNDRWQRHVDEAAQWQADGIVLQRDFFRTCIQPFLERKIKACVLISDAFRFEVGEELQSLIRQEDKFEATLEPMLSMLPSYTQLGMAALLPNHDLQLADNDSGDALVDGQSARGSVNRGKILAAAVPASAVVRARDVLAMGRDDTRALLRDHDVVYVYHNRIDKTGDTRDTEERVFDAAQETLDELIRLVKKLINANASNVLITADHGFIYQNHALHESDFLSAEPQGDPILYHDRRFVLGHNLREGSGFKSFSPAQLGLTGTVEVQIPKSICRLRLRGSGSRFVHGGATLQEVVIPLLRVTKKRQSDVRKVEVELIGTASRTITTGQLAVMLYQTEAATEKLQPRHLHAALFTLTGEPISDEHELVFDFSAESPREREVPVRFILSRKADAVNNQQVELRLR
ncbi:MAG TPA: BREX-1 system phosphatase PglZ type A, partial [Devosia sp.]|nr:BREX-1 system phosphatase PglZ type A [Devosia sp.]